MLRALLTLLILLSCGSNVGDTLGESRNPLLGGDEVACDIEPVVAIGDYCSGVLLHPRLVVFAGHCGSDVPFVQTTYGKFFVDRCEVMPQHNLYGSDLAYCLLTEAVPLKGARPAIAAGCELEAARESEEIIVFARGAPTFELRTGNLGVERFDTEIVARSAAVGICEGDSGAPVFAYISGQDSYTLRLVGVVSAGPPGCKLDEEVYITPLAPFIDWLEQRSGFDLTPCHTNDGEWKATPDCLSVSSLIGPECVFVASDGVATQPWALCGESSPIGVHDHSPPSISLELEDHGAAGMVLEARAISFLVRADERQGGVREVRLSLQQQGQEQQEQPLLSVAATLPPFVLPTVWLRPGSYYAAAEAEDFDGNIGADQIEFEIPEKRTSSSCAMLSRPFNVSMPDWIFFFALLLGIGWRRERNRMKKRKYSPQRLLGFVFLVISCGGETHRSGSSGDTKREDPDLQSMDAEANGSPASQSMDANGPSSSNLTDSENKPSDGSDGEAFLPPGVSSTEEGPSDGPSSQQGSTTLAECPPVPPSEGGECDAAQALCTYGDSVRAECRERWRCTGSSGWRLEPTECPEVPDAYCPDVPPDGDCTPLDALGNQVEFQDGEIACTYADSTVCVCRDCSDEACAGGPNWECIHPPEDLDCPTGAPNIGQPCEVQGLVCDYGDPCVSGALRMCREGVWHPRSYSCDGQ